MKKAVIFCLFFLLFITVNCLPKHDIRNSGTKHKSELHRKRIPTDQVSHSTKHGINFLDQKLSTQKVDENPDDDKAHTVKHEEPDNVKERINPKTKIVTPDIDDAILDVVQQESKVKSVPDVEKPEINSDEHDKPNSSETADLVSDKVEIVDKTSESKSELSSTEELEDGSPSEESKPSAASDKVKDSSTSKDSVVDSVEINKPASENVEGSSSKEARSSSELSKENANPQDSQNDSQSKIPEDKTIEAEINSESEGSHEEESGDSGSVIQETEAVVKPQKSKNTPQLTNLITPSKKPSVAEDGDPSSNELETKEKVPNKKTPKPKSKNEDLKPKTTSKQDVQNSSKEKKTNEKSTKMVKKDPKVDLPPLAMHPEISDLIHKQKVNQKKEKKQDDKPIASQPDIVSKSTSNEEKKEAIGEDKKSKTPEDNGSNNLKVERGINEIDDVDEDEIREEAEEQYERSSSANHRGLLYATLSIIGITLIVTVIGAYYKKLSFGSGRYSQHYPLSTEDDDSIFLNNRRADILDSNSTDYDSWKEFSVSR